MVSVIKVCVPVLTFHREPSWLIRWAQLLFWLGGALAGRLQWRHQHGDQWWYPAYCGFISVQLQEVETCLYLSLTPNSSYVTCYYLLYQITFFFFYIHGHKIYASSLCHFFSNNSKKKITPCCITQHQVQLKRSTNAGRDWKCAHHKLSRWRVKCVILSKALQRLGVLWLNFLIYGENGAKREKVWRKKWAARCELRKQSVWAATQTEGEFVGKRWGNVSVLFLAALKRG